MNSNNVNAEQIQSMCAEGRLRINMKPQRSGQGNNYLFNPYLSLTFTNVSVIEVGSKYVVFRLNQSEGEECMRLGKHLQNYLKRSYYVHDTLPFYNIVNENDNGEFLIRCYYCLPQSKRISLQRLQQIQSITLDIKNVWHLPDKLGFNVELINWVL